MNAATVVVGTVDAILVVIGAIHVAGWLSDATDRLRRRRFDRIRRARLGLRRELP